MDATRCSCGSTEFTYYHGLRCCLECSVESFAENYFVGTFQDTKRTNEITRSSYSSKSHFISVLDSIICSDDDLPQEILRIVVNDLRLFGIKEDRVTYHLIKNILKRNKLSRYSMFINQILKSITGISINVDSRLREQLINDFDIVLSAFESIEKQRKNFMNVIFVLDKLLKRHNIKFDLPVMKNRDRLLWHEDVWDQLKNELKDC